jgi:hypothetical protein
MDFSDFTAWAAKLSWLLDFPGRFSVVVYQTALGVFFRRQSLLFVADTMTLARLCLVLAR